MTSFYAALANQPVAGGVPIAGEPVMTISREHRQHALASIGLAGNARIVAFAPGAEFGPAKRWPPSHFAELARLVQQRYPDVHVLLLGSPKDRTICDEIVAPPGVRNRGGDLAWNAIAILGSAAALVTNDSD
jgi:heptosyltransferase-2